VADDRHPRTPSGKPASVFWLHILHVFIQPYHAVNEPELAEIDNTSTEQCRPKLAEVLQIEENNND
jgi:hypothetical protein